MKAIIQGHEINLEQSDNTWHVAGEDGVKCSLLNDGRLLIHANGQVFTARLQDVNREEKVLTLYFNGKKTEEKIT